jgi:hypothetical protein
MYVSVRGADISRVVCLSACGGGGRMAARQTRYDFIAALQWLQLAKARPGSRFFSASNEAAWSDKGAEES